MLEVTGIETFYGDNHVLYGVSLTVPKGTIVTMLGRNGMGKTTIIRSIMGLVVPRNGTIRFNGEDLIGLEPNEIARKGLGLVPQGRGIFPSLSVKENLTIAARKSEVSAGWDLERLYGLFPILKQRAKLYGNLLSGGEQQMLSVARALMANPDLLIMGEPSEGLAPLVVREIGKMIRQLKETHSVLLAEQNINMALGIADYVYVISKEMVAYESVPGELRQNQEVKVKHLGV